MIFGHPVTQVLTVLIKIKNKKITKPCKWVGVWLCVFIFSKKKIKKNVNSCVMGWPNIIYHK
jgi:hypothetical protein